MLFACLNALQSIGLNQTAEIKFGLRPNLGLRLWSWPEVWSGTFV